jgi:prephenate dehydrogenase
MANFNVGRVAVIGLGLIGGSFVKAIRHAGIADTIIGYDRAADTMSAALADGAIDEGAETPHAAVASADVVVLATPVRVILSLLEEIAPVLVPHCKVFDLGSTKREIVAAMNRLPPYVSAVGGHPMAGKTSGGWNATDGTLFQNAPFALCATDRTPVLQHSWAEFMVRAIGAKPLFLDPAEHDEAVARVSHLPYILSSTLVRAAQPSGTAAQLAAGSYRDTSRVSAHDPRMYGDILLTNRDNVLAAIRRAQSILGDLETALEHHDEEAMKAWMAKIKTKEY